MLGCWSVSWAQTPGIQLKRSIQAASTFVTFDNLGNFYSAFNEEISKYDAKGDFLLSESNKVLGNVATIDASNPLKLLLFYADFGQIAFTDNRLATRGEILQLDQLGLVQSSMACTSYNSGFWVFDQVTFELIRFDRNMRETNRTGNLQQIVGTEMHITYMLESGNWLYVKNEGTGIMVFDIYGTYYKTLPLKGGKKFSIYQNVLFYADKSKLVAYQLKTAEMAEMELPVQQIADFSVHANQLLVSTGKEIKLYQIIE